MHFPFFGKLKSKVFKPVYDGKHWDFSNGCPDCDDKQIYEGPSGGMCTNICCANPFCRSAFNDLGIANMVQRIPNTYFRSAFPECPEESESYEKVQINGSLKKETDDFISSLENNND